jgi:imidazolonepropionase-like amidohydrolase
MGLYENGTPFGFDTVKLDTLGYGAEIESTKKNVRRMREAGVRVLPGGDYGFGWTPHGTYAKDLQYFVELFGYTPFDALMAATRDAGEMVGFGGGRVGTLEAGKLADLILVAGNPTLDITVLQERSKIVAVMKSGKLYHYALDGPNNRRGLPFAKPTAIGWDAESLEVALTAD